MARPRGLWQALRTEPIGDRLGIRAGDVGSIFMSDVEVAESDRIGDEGDGFKIAMSCLDNGRYTVAAGATGTVRACVDASVKYARERKTFGQEIGALPAGAADDRQDVARLRDLPPALLQGRLDEEHRQAPYTPVSMAKQYATDAAFNAAHDAVEVHGAYGYSAE